MVDSLTGIVTLARTDFTLPGQLPLEWSRSYQSALAVPGTLGYNWSFSFGHYLEARADGFDFVHEDGSRYALPFLSTIGESIYHGGAHLRATRVTEERYEIRLKTNLTYVFEWPALQPRARLVEIRDLNGWAVSLRYDHRSRLSQVTDSAARLLVCDCDQNGNLTAVRLRSNSGDDDLALARYRYDERGDLVQATDAAGHSELFVYDPNHRVIMYTNKLSHAYYFEYDLAGRCTRMSSDCGLFEHKLLHMPESRSVAVTKPNGATETLRHDEGFRLVQRIDPYGASTSYSYSRLGRLESELDPNGNASRIAYDDFGNVVERTELDGTKWVWKYDQLGLKTEETNPAGAKRAWKYDERGNLLEETDAQGLKTVHAYDERGLRTQTITPDQAVQRFRYSQQGLLAAILNDSNAPVLELSYDARGNVVERKSTNGVARFTYDAMGRRTETVLTDGSRLRKSYDAEGNIVSDEEAPGCVWSYAYEKCNLRIGETDPTGLTTRIAYTKGGNVAEVVDPGGTKTEYGYDLNSRVATISRNDRLRESFGIDPAGNFVRKSDRHGEPLLTQEIAPLNRPEMRVGRNIESRFAYDQAGRMISATRAGNSVAIKYDELDRATELTWNNDSLTRSFAHNQKFSQLKWSEGLKCEFEYPEAGPSCVIKDPCGGTHKVFARVESLLTRYLPNGISEVKALNPAGGLSQLVLRKQTEASDRPIFFLSQKFDEADRISERRYHHSDRSTQFQHDALDRLTLVAHADEPRRTIRYDAGGNALPSEGAAVQPGNLLVSSGDLSYRYDERGNVLERRLDGRSASFTYDSWDELVAARTADGEEVSFEYDGFNKRCAKSRNGLVTRQNWHEHLLHRELRPDSSRRIFVYETADDVVPFMFVDLVFDEHGTCVAKLPYYIHSDGVGCPVAISDEQGEIVWTLEVNPFGEFRVADPNGLCFQLRYPGQYYDSEIGLCYNGYRVFDPLSHRFLQSDPLGLAAGLNLYQFPGDPLQVRDLLGECGDGLPTKGNPKDLQDGQEVTWSPRKSDAEYEGTVMKTPDGDAAVVNNPNNLPVHPKQGEAQDLANKLHEAQSSSRQEQTVAVGVMEDGSMVVTSKPTGLNPEQEAILQQHQQDSGTPVSYDNSNADAHAEQQLLDRNAQDNGDPDPALKGIAVSRPCCEGCAQSVNSSGAPPTSMQPTNTQQKLWPDS